MNPRTPNCGPWQHNLLPHCEWAAKVTVREGSRGVRFASFTSDLRFAVGGGSLRPHGGGCRVCHRARRLAAAGFSPRASPHPGALKWPAGRIQPKDQQSATQHFITTLRVIDWICRTGHRGRCPASVCSFCALCFRVLLLAMGLATQTMLMPVRLSMGLYPPCLRRNGATLTAPCRACSTHKGERASARALVPAPMLMPVQTSMGCAHHHHSNQQQHSIIITRSHLGPNSGIPPARVWSYAKLI